MSGNVSFEQAAFLLLLQQSKIAGPDISKFYIHPDYVTFLQARSLLEECNIESPESIIRDNCYSGSLACFSMNLDGTLRNFPHEIFGNNKIFSRIKYYGTVLSSKPGIPQNQLKSFNENEDDYSHELILFKKDDILILCKLVNGTVQDEKPKEQKETPAQRRTNALALFLKHIIMNGKLEPTQLPFTSKDLIYIFNEKHHESLKINNKDNRGFISRAKKHFIEIIGMDVAFSKDSQGGGVHRINEILSKFPYKT